jgi:hypothetical protein
MHDNNLRALLKAVHPKARDDLRRVLTRDPARRVDEGREIVEPPRSAHISVARIANGSKRS